MELYRKFFAAFMSIVLVAGLCPLQATAAQTAGGADEIAEAASMGDAAGDAAENGAAESGSARGATADGEAIGTGKVADDAAGTDDAGEATADGLEKSFATQLAEQVEAGDANAGAGAQLLEAPYADDDMVTLIVHLEGDADAGAGDLSTQSNDTREEVKGQITNLINGREADESAAWWQSIPFLSAQSNTELDVKYDYSTLIQAFAVSVPYRYVSDIQKLPGVANAFIEHTYTQADTEVTAQSDVYNISSLRMVGADSSDYTGKGSVAAIIDSGVATGHEAFAALGDGYALSAEDVAERVASAGSAFHGTGYRYVNSKIPFSYDYADGDDEATPSSSINEHGTHVAGIVAANGGDIIRGVAPDAQIVPMKVATDLLGTISDSDIIAALEDAVNLGVDTINMSLGSDAGFPTDNDEEYQLIYDSVKDHGVMLNVAAGNADSSAAYNYSGSDLAYATDPDNSIVAAPSTYAASMSVASVNAVATLPYVTIAGDGSHILCQPSSLGGTGFADLNGTFDLYDAGYGLDADYAATTDGETTTELARGKIALIERGGLDEDGSSITFERKATYAANHGAVAAIIYNNIADDAGLVTMAITDETRIPAVFVTNANGLKLVDAAAAAKKVTVSNAQMETTEGMTMSSFSSIGVNADMDLKPEITAPGGNIYSSVLENGYSTMSGTSMATPHMAGLTADVAQYVKAKNPDASKTEVRRLTNALLMSSAQPVADTEEGRANTYYTPRKQGAGLANLAKATTSPAYLSVEGSDLPKGNLGSSTTGWTLEFTVNNMGGTALTYNLDTAALSADIENGLFSRHSTNYTGAGIDVTYAGAGVAGSTVTVPANGTATVAATITPGDAFKNAVSAATAGTFVDGFVMLKAASGTDVDLSIPYVGFYGSWSTPRIFDSVEGDGTSAHIRTTYPFHTNTSTQLGLNPLNTTGSRVDTGKYTVAPYSYLQRCASMNTATALLRSVSRLTYTVTPKGASNVVSEHSYNDVRKSYMYTSSGIVTYAEAFLGAQPTFDGIDSTGAVLPAGWYTETIQGCVMDGDDTPDDAISFDVYLDTQAPEVTATRIVETQEWDNDALTWKAVKKIEVDVSDAGFIAGVQLATTNGGAASTVNLVPTASQVMDADHDKSTATYVFDYDDVMSRLGQAPSANQNKVLANVYDYGLNLTESDVVLKDTYPTGISIDPASASISVGQTAQLDGVLEGDSLTATRVSWKSSDESIATVDSAGLVAGIAPGTATITATAEAPAGQTAPTATAQVTVSEISDDVGIVLDRSTLDSVEGADFTLTATKAASLSGSSITWEVADPTVVKLTSQTNTSASFRALRAGTTTVTAQAGGKTATCTVKVEAQNASDFVIDENGVLIDYVGSSVDVVIPSNVTAIGTRSNYTGTYTPGDDDNPVEAVGVFQGLPIETVVIPESVTSIGDYAFDSCQYLRHVEIKAGSQLKNIGRNAFSETYKLSAIELPDTVETLGIWAFYYSGIMEFTVPPKVTELADYVFAYDSGMSKLTVKGNLTRIGKGALMITSGLWNMTPLNEGITEIGAMAFEGCGLSSITLPSTVKTVGDSAFMSASARTVALNEGLESIGQNAFYEAGIETLSIPDSVISVGQNLAMNATSLESLHIGKNVNKLVTPLVDTLSLTTVTVDADNPNMSVESAYGCLCDKGQTEIIAYPLGRKDSAVTLPAGIETIDDYAFCNAESLASLAFDDELKTIGGNAFRATGLTSISDTKNLETIYGNAFANCASLASVELAHVKNIGAYCFAYDDRLTSITFGDALVTIGEAALIDTVVREVSLPDTCTTIGQAAWSNNAYLKRVHLGAGLASMPGGTFTNCFGLEEITVADGNARYFAEDSVLYERGAGNPAELTVKVCAIESGITSFTAASGTVRIDDFAFARCETLKTVVLPIGVKELGISAFNGCTGLTSISLPDGLESIGDFALGGLDKLTTLTIPASIKHLDEYSFAFSSIRYLVLLGASAPDMIVPGYLDDIRSLYIGPGFAGIEMFAFEDSEKLRTVVVNSDITDIDDDAFNNSVATAFYVNPDYPDAYAAVEALDIGTVQDYTPLEVRCTTSPMQLSAGSPATIDAASFGGVGTMSFRFAEVDGDDETFVSGSWSSSAKSYTVPSLPAEGKTIKAYVRDSTMLSSSQTITLSPGYATGTYAADMKLLASADADAQPSPLDALVESGVTLSIDATTASVDMTLSPAGAATVRSIAPDGGSAATPETRPDGSVHVSLTVPGFTGSFPVAIATDYGTGSAVAFIDMDGAAPVASKTALVKSIESTSTLNGARYTTATWNALSNALDAALAVNADAKASQSAVDNATAKLDAALDKLVRNDVDHSWSAGDAGIYDVRLGLRQELYASNCENYQSLVNKQAKLVRAEGGALSLRITILPAQLGSNGYSSGGYVTAQDLYEAPTLGDSRGTLVEENAEEGWATYEFSIASITSKPRLTLYYYPKIYQDQTITITLKQETISSPYEDDAADKTALIEAYNRAAALDLDAYLDDDARAAFEDALSTAKSALKFKSVSQADADEALDALVVAMRALSPAGDAAALAAVADNAKAYLAGNYSKETIQALKDAIEDARTASALSPGADEAIAYAQAVVKAFIELAATGDDSGALAAAREDLEAALAAATSLLAGDLSSVPAELQAQLGSAKTSAEAAKGNASASVGDIIAATDELEQSIRSVNDALDADGARSALSEAVADAATLSQGRKSTSAYATLRDAVSAAAKMADDPLASPAELGEALETLEAAVSAFETSNDCADTLELSYAIEKAQAALDDGTDKTGAAKASFGETISAAQATVAAAGAEGSTTTQAEVDAQIKALDDARATFSASVEQATLDSLTGLISNVKATDKGNKIESAWTALQAAIGTAESVRDDASLTEEAAQKAIDDLREAAIAFGQADVAGDKTDLAAAIAQGDTVTQGSKTNAAWNQYGAALASAKAVYANGDATQQQVDEATANLLAAIETFANAEEKATAELAALITTAQALPQASFTSSTWNTLQSVLSSAQATLSNAQASDDTLAGARDNLQTALENLELTDEGTHIIPITYLQHNSNATSEAASYLKSTAEISSDGNGGFKLTISVNPGYERYNIRFSDESTGAEDKVFPHENPYDFTMTIGSMFAKNSAWVHLNPIYEMHHQFDIVLDPTGIVSETADTLGMISGRVYTATSDIWKADNSGQSMAASFFEPVVEMVKLTDSSYYAMLTATETGRSLGVRLYDATGENALEVISESPLVFKVPIADPTGKTRIVFRYSTTAVTASSSFATAESGDPAVQEGELTVQAEDVREADLYFPGLSDGSATVSVEAVDKTALSDALASAGAVERGSKTDAAFAELGAAIQEAQALVDRSDATQAEVNAEIAKLAAAVEAFASSPEREGDKTVLNSVIKGAQASLDATATSADGSDVPPSQTWTTAAERSALQTALADAQAVVADVNAAQDVVDAAVQSLAAAHAAFDSARKAGAKPDAPAVERVTMHRLYNPNSGEHFYTGSAGERDSLVQVGWRFEGTGWVAPSSSDTPVYRLYNPNAGDHHYTTSAWERDSLMSVGWRYEGIGWYSDDAQGVALYRLYNPNAKSGAHHYTTSAGERDSLVQVGWRSEDIGWYGLE